MQCSFAKRSLWCSPCLRGLCSAEQGHLLAPGEGSVGSDGRCPAASSKFPTPGTRDASLLAPGGTSQHNHCLASYHFHPCHSETGAVPPVPLGSTHQSDTSSKHPSQQVLLSHGNPCFPSNSPGGTPLHSSLILLFICLRKPAKSSACLPVKSCNNYIIGVKETTPQRQRRCVGWVKLAWLLGILGNIFFQCVASFITASLWMRGFVAQIQV